MLIWEYKLTKWFNRMNDKIVDNIFESLICGVSFTLFLLGVFALFHERMPPMYFLISFLPFAVYLGYKIVLRHDK